MINDELRNLLIFNTLYNLFFTLFDKFRNSLIMNYLPKTHKDISPPSETNP
jgi:hypothetical protein